MCRELHMNIQYFVVLQQARAQKEEQTKKAGSSSLERLNLSDKELIIN